MFKLAFLLVCAFVYTAQAQPDPGAAMQAGAVVMMSAVQSGAAAGDERQVEFFGAKAGHKTQIGFGDAVRPVADDSDDESDERRRRKRSVLAFVHDML